MKYIPLVLLSFLFFNAHAQNVSFEDPDFLSALIKEGIDSNGDGVIQQTEAESVYDIDISGEDFVSLKGIEGFVNLEYLSLYSNDLIDTIDVLGLPNLIDLTIGNSPALRHVNVSGHSRLKEIFVAGPSGTNLYNLKTLSFENMLNLEKLRIAFIQELEQLTIQNVDNLVDLNLLTYNAMPYLDLTHVPNLEILTIGGNENGLSQLELGVYENLHTYTMYIEEPPASAMDLSHFPNIQYLHYPGGYNNIPIIEISNNETLEEVHIENFFTLHTIHCSKLPSLNILRIGICNELKTLVVDSLINAEEISLLSAPALQNVNISNCFQVEELSLKAEDKLRNISLENLTQLATLDIHSNRIKAVDFSTLPSLQELAVNSTSVEQLYCKNGSNENLNCIGCEDLAYLCLDAIDTPTNIPSQTVQGDFCPHTSDGNLNKLTGTIRLDYGDNECTENAIPIPFVSVELFTQDSTLGQIVINSAGEYSVNHNLEAISIQAVGNEFNQLFTFDPATATALYDENALAASQDFCVKAVEDFLDLEVVMMDAPLTRPGERATYTIKVRNIGTIDPQGNLILSFDGDYMDVFEVIPDAFSIEENRVIWNIPSLQAFQEIELIVSFDLNTPTDDFPLDVGDTLRYDISASFVGESELERVFNSLEDIVVNSQDPNDKQCLQGRFLELQNLGDYLYYMIRFENLGTADALHIVVQDTLDESTLDISTFQLVEASHELETILDRNILSFVFEDINLGFEDDVNDGYLVFKIKANQEVIIGTEIENEASIYFDYNLPIHTNLAQIQLIENIDSGTTNTRIESIQVYPVLVQNDLTIEEGHWPAKIHITDMSGRYVFTKEIHENESVDVSFLQKGLYSIFLKHDGKNYVGRFIKM